MAKYGKGLICTPVSDDIAQKLNFHAMVEKNTDNHETAFTVTVDHKNTTTGISAFERAETIKEIVNEKSQTSDFRRPGHVFPLISKKGGVLKRTGHTEASIDLCKLAGLKEVAVICEIMKDDGEMARVPELIEFVKEANSTPAKRALYGMIQASTYDNEANLPDDYISSLFESYPPQLISAYLRGQFVNLTSGAVYPDFDRKLNHTDEEIEPLELLIIGMDFNVLKMAAVS